MNIFVLIAYLNRIYSENFCATENEVHKADLKTICCHIVCKYYYTDIISVCNVFDAFSQMKLKKFLHT